MEKHEFLCKTTIEYPDEDSILNTTISVEHSDRPLQDGTIRSNILRKFFTKREGDKISMKGLVYNEMGK